MLLYFLSVGNIGNRQYRLFIEALDEGSNWSKYNMWTHLDEYYGDNSDYDWWKNRSLLFVPYPYMDILGLPTMFGQTIKLKEKLVARLTGEKIGMSRYLRSKSMNRMKPY